LIVIMLYYSQNVILGNCIHWGEPLSVSGYKAFTYAHDLNNAPVHTLGKYPISVPSATNILMLAM
jgi:hypothetical protein